MLPRRGDYRPSSRRPSPGSSQISWPSLFAGLVNACELLQNTPSKKKKEHFFPTGRHKGHADRSTQVSSSSGSGSKANTKEGDPLGMATGMEGLLPLGLWIGPSQDGIKQRGPQIFGNWRNFHRPTHLVARCATAYSHQLHRRKTFASLERALIQEQVGAFWLHERRQTTRSPTAGKR